MATKTAENTKITRKLLPKQWDFLESISKELLYSGAFGAGKTYTLCEKALKQACIPRNRVGVGRKTLKALKQSTLITLIEGDGKTPPVIPGKDGVHYRYHKTNNEIKIAGGGTIVLFGIDHPETLGSWPLGSCYVDECIELTEADWIMLMGRCRNTADPIRQLGGACNPAHPNHWLAKRFGISGSAVKNTELIQTCSADNHHLPADYLEQLGTLTGTDYERYVLGKWVGYEGLVYDEWDPDIHVYTMPDDFQYEQVVAAIDQGFTHPAVRLSIGTYHIGDELALHIFDEFYQTGVTPSAFIDMCIGRAARENTNLHIVDPAAADMIAELCAKGLPAIGGDNPILDGIRAVKTFLRIDAKKIPRLTIDPRCKATIGEMTAYTWKPEKDMPVDKDDHAMDALRYACKHFGGAFVAPSISFLGERKVEHSASTLTFEDVHGVEEEDETGNVVRRIRVRAPREEQFVESVTADGDFGWDEW